MNVKDTLYWAQRNYPQINTCEEDVLHHLFFVIGNGYKWDNGELVDKYETDPEETFRASKAQYEWYSEIQKGINETSDNLLSLLEEVSTPDQQLFETVSSLHKTIFAFENTKDLQAQAAMDRVGPKSIDLSPNSKILHIPKDVKPDWLAAAKRVILLAKEGYWEIASGDLKILLDLGIL